MKRFIPGTRSFREYLRALATEDDGKTTDPVGLYSMGSRAYRRTLVRLGGRTAHLAFDRPFRAALTPKWFMFAGVWTDAGRWRDGVAWQ